MMAQDGMAILGQGNVAMAYPLVGDGKPLQARLYFGVIDFLQVCTIPQTLR